MMESELSMSPSPLRSTQNSPSLGEADEGKHIDITHVLISKDHNRFISTYFLCKKYSSSLEDPWTIQGIVAKRQRCGFKSRRIVFNHV